MYDTDDTIVAIGTADGGAARGLVRISGPNAAPLVASCFRPREGQSLQEIRRATALSGEVHIRLSQAAMCDARAAAVDCDLFLWPDERSYTRAPLAELHTFGSRPILDAVVDTLCSAGARLAEPGEFTLRAFLAGRIDLTQAEAVLGVIDASGQGELNAALAQMAGGLARPLVQLRDELMQLLAELEAGLDFVEEDIQFVSAHEIANRLESAARLLADVGEQFQTRGTADRLAQVVLVGPPNVGKSSLFNALVARRAALEKGGDRSSAVALVSPQRGTTRDYLTARLSLGAFVCELIDTAGIEESESEAAVNWAGDDGAKQIGAAAQTAATGKREQAAIRVWCVDFTAIDDGSGDAFASAPLEPARDLVVLTKSDLSPAAFIDDVKTSSGVRRITTSSRSGQGLDELENAIHTLLSNAAGDHTAVVETTADRCRESIRLAAAAIARAREIAADQGGDELTAAEIHVAIDELGKVVGAVYTDDLLDRIFSTFCIGK
jgi:tRNA modification GTPase